VLPEHDCPVPHALPQVPQFLLSLVVSVQVPLHEVWPVGHPASVPPSFPPLLLPLSAPLLLPLSVPLLLPLSVPLLLPLSAPLLLPLSTPLSTVLSGLLLSWPPLLPSTLESLPVLASMPAHAVAQLLSEHAWTA
jgi:hypothetical protein